MRGCMAWVTAGRLARDGVMAALELAEAGTHDASSAAVRHAHLDIC